mgnify:CR=1 FL=1
MKPSSRALIALVVLMGGWLFWYSSYGIWQPKGLEPREPLGGHSSGPTSRDLPLLAGMESGSPIRTTRVAPPVEDFDFQAGEWRTKENVRSDQVVLVEVLVALGFDDGDPQAPPLVSPGSFAGIDVHAQSWDESTDETFAHKAQTDEQGIARFEFPGACHLDWIRADMPPGLEHLAGFADPHEDVPAGSIVRFSLVVVEGVRVAGRVTDTTGGPLGDILIWASGGAVEKRDKEIEDEWYPASYETRSRPDGTFEFTGLPDHDLLIGVAPGEWLQVAPGTPNSAEEPEWEEVDPLVRARFGSQPGVLVVSNISLVQRERVDLILLDADGAPVPFGSLSIEPLMLVAPNLLGEEQWERQMDSAQTEWERNRVRSMLTWPRSAGLEVAADGSASFYGAAGSWRIHASTRLECSFRDFQIYVRPGDSQVHQLRFLKTMSTITGSVIDGKTQQPIVKAKVRLTVGRCVDTVETGGDGRFELAGVPLDGPFRLRVSHEKYFTEEREADLDQLPLEFSMSRASEVALQFLDHAGQPIAHHRVRLVRRNGEQDQTPLSDDGKFWLSLLPVPIAELNTTGNGRVLFDHLYPGSYDVELELKTDTGGFGIWGEPLAESKVWGRWSVKASDVARQITVDLTEHQLTRFPGYLTLHGLVRSQNGYEPIAGAEIRVTCGGRSTSVYSSSVGAFSVDGLAGLMRYEVSAPGHKSVEGSLRKDFGGKKSMRFDLEPIE